MRQLIKSIHWIFLGLAITGYFFEILSPKPYFTLVLGILGAIYCIVHIGTLTLFRITFDRILSKGGFLIRVMNFVLLVPFVLLVCFYANDWLKDSKIDYSPKNLIYEDKLYTDKDAEVDYINHSELSDVDKHFIRYDRYEVQQDSVLVRKKILPKSISDKQSDPSLFWSLYFHYLDPGNQHMTTSESGRQQAALTAILGYFLLNGLLVSTLISWFDRRKEKWIKGEVRYNYFLRLKSHYVIIGGNDVVVGIVKQILGQIYARHRLFKPYILIQTSRDVEDFRRELFSSLTPREQQRIIIYYGSRDAEVDINDLCLGKAKEVYMLGEEARTDDTESYHDTINMKSMALINASFESTLRRKLIARYSAWADSTKQQRMRSWLKHRCEAMKLTCRVMFEYQTTFNIVQVTDINMECIKFMPFNYYEMWAQHVLVCQKLKDDNAFNSYKPLEGYDGIKPDDDTFVHLVIVGMSRMGSAMAIEAAHLAHYPNFDNNKRRTRITFIDEAMSKEKHFFMGRFKELFAIARYRDVEVPIKDIYNQLSTYPWIEPMDAEDAEYHSSYLGKDFVDVEWEFINGSVENPHIQQYLADAASNPHAKLTIAVCIPENSSAIAAASYMPDSVYESNSTLQVLVYQRMNNDLLKQIGQNNKRYHNKLRAFGMATECYNSSLVTIAESMSNSLNAKYDSYCYNLVMDYYKKHGICEEDLHRLSPSYGKIAERSDMQPLRDCVMGLWREWFEENLNNTNCTNRSISKKCSEIEAYIAGHLDENNKHSDANGGKARAAKMWSNTYNIYSMWTKFRCFGIDPTTSTFAPSTLEALGKMEHNRWVVEQLLLRYRPLKIDEQNEAKNPHPYTANTIKNMLKSKYAHLDICSNDKLKEIDPDIVELDKVLVEVLPTAYKEYLESKTKSN